MLTPMMYKYLGIALLAMAYGAFCYHKGYQAEHEKLITFQAEVTQKAIDQNEATKRKEAENEATTKSLAVAYSVDNNRLRAALEQLRKSTDRFSKLPKASQDSEGAYGTKQEHGRIEGCTQQFYENALEDSQKLEAWQEWAKRMNIEME